MTKSTVSIMIYLFGRAYTAEEVGLETLAGAPRDLPSKTTLDCR